VLRGSRSLSGSAALSTALTCAMRIGDNAAAAIRNITAKNRLSERAVIRFSPLGSGELRASYVVPVGSCKDRGGGLVIVQFEVRVNKLPSWDRRAAGSRSGSDIKRRRVVAIARGNFDLATTPALRATPPVPGGEPEFQTSATGGIPGPILCRLRRLNELTGEEEWMRGLRLQRQQPIAHGDDSIAKRFGS
jgi:hypothetical protein